MNNNNPPLYGVVCDEVIISTLKRRGTGKSPSPVREIIEVYRKDGMLIAEYDSFQDERVKLIAIEFARRCILGKADIDDINESKFDRFMLEVQNDFK